MKTVLSFCLVFNFLLVAAGLRGQVVDTAAVRAEVDSLLGVSRTMIKQRNFEIALNAQAKAEKLVLDMLGSETAEYGAVCHIRGAIAYYSGNYDNAERSYLDAINVRRITLGKEHQDYAQSLNSLGILYWRMGQYEKAELLYIEAKSIWGKLLGKEHPNYASSVNNLAILYKQLGQYEKAEMLNIEAKNIRKKTLGKDHLEYASSLNNLATLYTVMGKYDEAESLILESKNIREKALGKEHQDYATSLFNLALLYHNMGQYEKAEMFYHEAKNIWEEKLGKKHPNYIKSLNNLAGLYSSVGQYGKAELLLIEARDIWEAEIGKDNPTYAGYLVNLAVLYRNILQYEKAEQLYLESRTIFETNIENWNHPFYLNCLNNLAILYRDKGRFEESELLFLQDKSIREKILGKEHPDYAQTLDNLAIFYSLTDQYAKAEPLTDSTAQIVHTLLARAVQFSSEKDLGDYMNQENAKLARIPSYLLNGHFSSRMPQIAYDDALFQKGFLQNAGSRLNILTTTTPEADSLSQLLKSYRIRLSREYAKPIVERQGVSELEEKANALEGQLARTVAGYAEAIRQVKWAEVQAALKPGEVAMEFLHFPVLFPEKSDSFMYAALILTPKDTAPIFLPLFEERQLTALLEKTGSNAEASNLLYAARSGRLLGDKPTYGTELYNLIWKPLDSLLQKHGVKTVYFSPSGLLHRVSFSALPISPPRGGRGAKTLADRYQLHQLGSTRSLVVKTPEPVPQGFTAAVFGGVDYNQSQPAVAVDSTAIEVTDNRLWTYINRPKNRSDAEIFQYLDGTQTEAALISKTLHKHQIRTSTHTGARATEEALKALGRDTVKSPDILHIATHGFFFPDPQDSLKGRDREGVAFKWNENPLFRSGLALAGANRTWAREIDSTFTPGVIEDGIATAYEISHLNLSNTKLVVLSACESGLGDIKGSEGVYGLQRAFKMAGVNYLIVSLWKVPDPETADFMDTFYKYWLDGKTVREAFAKAQKKMRRKYKEVYKWGAWILME